MQLASNCRLISNLWRRKYLERGIPKVSYQNVQKQMQTWQVETESRSSQERKEENSIPVSRSRTIASVTFNPHRQPRISGSYFVVLIVSPLERTPSFWNSSSSKHLVIHDMDKWAWLALHRERVSDREFGQCDKVSDDGLTIDARRGASLLRFCGWDSHNDSPFDLPATVSRSWITKWKMDGIKDGPKES